MGKLRIDWLSAPQTCGDGPVPCTTSVGAPISPSRVARVVSHDRLQLGHDHRPRRRVLAASSTKARIALRLAYRRRDVTSQPARIVRSSSPDRTASASMLTTACRSASPPARRSTCSRASASARARARRARAPGRPSRPSRSRARGRGRSRARRAARRASSARSAIVNGAVDRRAAPDAAVVDRAMSSKSSSRPPRNGSPHVQAVAAQALDEQQRLALAAALVVQVGATSSSHRRERYSGSASWSASRRCLAALERRDAHAEQPHGPRRRVLAQQLERDARDRRRRRSSASAIVRARVTVVKSSGEP